MSNNSSTAPNKQEDPPQQFFFNNDFSHAPSSSSQVSIATLRSRYARQFRQKFENLYTTTVFSPEMIQKFELNSTRAISLNFFSSCRENKRSIIEFAVKMKLHVSTRFLSNEKTNSNNISNNNSNNNGLKMIERNMVYKMDAGIALGHSSRRQDILLLIGSAVCHFEDDERRQKLLSSDSSCLISSKKNFLFFILQFANDLVTSSGVIPRTTTVPKNVSNEQLLLLLEQCRDQFKFSTDDDSFVYEPQPSSSSMMFMTQSHRFTSSLDEQQQNELETCRQRVQSVLHEILSFSLEKFVASKNNTKISKSSNVLLNNKQLVNMMEEEDQGKDVIADLPKLIFESLTTKGAFQFFVENSDSNINNVQTRIMMNFEHLKPTCDFLLECFGITQKKTVHDHHQNNNHQIMTPFLFSRPINVTQQQSKVHTVIYYSFDFFTIIEISVIIFITALFLGRNDDDDDENKVIVTVDASTRSDNENETNFRQCFLLAMNHLQQNLKSKASSSKTTRRPREDEEEKGENNRNNGDNKNGDNKNENPASSSSSILKPKYNKKTKVQGRNHFHYQNKLKDTIFHLNSDHPDPLASFSAIRFERVTPAILFLLRHWKPLFVVHRHGLKLSYADEEDGATEEESRSNNSSDSGEEEENTFVTRKKNSSFVSDQDDDRKTLGFIVYDFEKETHQQQHFGHKSLFSQKKPKPRKQKPAAKEENDLISGSSIFDEFDDQSTLSERIRVLELKNHLESSELRNLHWRLVAAGLREEIDDDEENQEVEEQSLAATDVHRGE